MAILRYKEIGKMSKEDLNQKTKDLKMELVKSGVTANKATAKTKEIKRAIARIYTFNNSVKGALKK